MIALLVTAYVAGTLFFGVMSCVGMGLGLSPGQAAIITFGWPVYIPANFIIGLFRSKS